MIEIFNGESTNKLSVISGLKVESSRNNSED